MNKTLDTFDDELDAVPSDGIHDDDYSATTEDESPTPDRTEKTEIGAEENRKVVYSRILVCVVLLGCAAIAAALTYVVTDNEEQDNFERDVSS